MDMQELIRRTAWQAGTSEDEADRLVEAFLHEVRAAGADGGTVRLGRFGTFHGPAFVPGSMLLERVTAALAETEGYGEGTAPSDS